MNATPTWITACIPTFRCTDSLRAAVKSLLNQTYSFLRVIVINDGDLQSPWPVLGDITDPRLIRFNLRENRGPYFALAVALEATPDPFFLIQDADDWSEPERVAKLYGILRRDNSNYACSALAMFYEDSSGKNVECEPLFAEQPSTVPNAEFRYRIPHHGLFRTDSLRQLGGYFGGFRFGYDKLLTNLILVSGLVSWTPEHLYWRRIRPDSLTRSPNTGLTSNSRRIMDAEMAYIYQQVYTDYHSFASHKISGQRLVELIRSRIQSRCGALDRRRIHEHAESLRAAMNTQCALHEARNIRTNSIANPTTIPQNTWIKSFQNLLDVIAPVRDSNLRTDSTA